MKLNRENISDNREIIDANREFYRPNTILFSLSIADEESEMLEENGAWRRQSESFWRAHHEAWKRSDLNRRRYCEVEGIPLKAFGNWRAQFKAEPQPPERKLLYRRRGLSHPLPLSHPLSHGAYPSSSPGGPIVPRPTRRASAVQRSR